jgi:hypothetical protein
MSTTYLPNMIYMLLIHFNILDNAVLSYLGARVAVLGTRPTLVIVVGETGLANCAFHFASTHMVTERAVLGARYKHEGRIRNDFALLRQYWAGLVCWIVVMHFRIVRKFL